MAEQEIVKHTKKVYKIWHSPEHSKWEKIKEFFIEIFIIVFAVTLSIWLHSWSEHRHQQQEVKDFMMGLKDDLTKDVKEMNEDKNSYKKCIAAYNLVLESNITPKIEKDSINKHSKWQTSTIRLVPNNGRFEGFKSSGKIGNIENQELQNNIMDLYQENIPDLLNNSDGYNDQKAKFINYIQENLTRDKNDETNYIKLLSSKEVRSKAYSLKNVEFIAIKYDSCIAKMKKIIMQIDKEYN